MLTVTRTILLTRDPAFLLTAPGPTFRAPPRRSFVPQAPAPARSDLVTRAALASAPSPDAAAGALLPFIPRPVKLLALGVLLLHYRSWPFYWHLRVFRPLVVLRLRAVLFFAYVRVCILLARAARALRLPGIPTRPTPPILALGMPGARQQFSHSLAQRALGAAGPLDVQTTWSGRAGLDDCDWNWHLSNSAYAKNFDYARADFLAAFLAPFLADGGAPALGGAEFHFVREVPLGRAYEIEVRIGAWDEKWMYLVGRFVSRKTSAERRKEKGKAKAAAATFTPSPRAVPFLNFPAPAVKKDLGDLKDLSASFTTAADDSDALSVASSASTVELALDEAAALLPSALTAERTTHAVGIARYAFKHAASASRRSIPPALVLATCGFSAAEWERMQRMRYAGAPGDARAFWAGGWAEVPAGERWWERAAGAWEEGRKAGMEELGRR